MNQSELEKELKRITETYSSICPMICKRVMKCDLCIIDELKELAKKFIRGKQNG